MQISASAMPVPRAEIDRLRQEQAEIIRIYRRLYPDDDLEMIFWQGNDPAWGNPRITEGAASFQAADFAAAYLGRHRSLSGRPGARLRTIRIEIPRPPRPDEMKNTDAPWQPMRGLGRLFRLWPMAYEHIRYRAEIRRRRLCRSRHPHEALPLNRGSVALPPLAGDEGPDMSKRPAILIGFHWLEVGGAEKLAFDCVDWALAAGLRVFVIASVRSIQRLADRLPDHPDLRFIRLDRYLPQGHWPQFLQQLARDENIRLVHVHHCEPLYASLAHLRATAPWVKVVDSTHIVEYANGGYVRISGVWSNYIDHHHVISRQLVDYYRDVFHVMHKVLLGRMLPRQDRAALPPLNMQPGQKQLRVAFIGRMYYQKRPVVLVAALRALDRWARAKGVELKATIVGEGPFDPTVQALLRRHGLADRAEIQPANADIPGLLGNSDILLLPSNNEGLALVCYEAIQHGCIPISTDVGSQGEIVPPDLLVPLEPFATVRETVKAVDRLWRDADFLARQQGELHERFANIASDPTAEEILMPIYRAAAQAGAAE